MLDYEGGMGMEEKVEIPYPPLPLATPKFGSLSKNYIYHKGIL